MRLNKDTKEAIIVALLDEKVNKRLAEAKLNRGKIGDEVYMDVYGDYIDIMEKLPPNYMVESNSALVLVRYGHHTLCVYTSVARPMAYKHACLGSMAKVYEPGNELAQRYLEADKKVKALISEKRDLQSDLRLALRKITSWKNLYEFWPDIKPIVSHLERHSEKKELAIPITDLNKRLGILK